MNTLQLALGATALAVGLSQTTLGQQPPLPLSSGASAATTYSATGGRQPTWRTGKMRSSRRRFPVVQAAVATTPRSEPSAVPSAAPPARTVFGAEATPAQSPPAQSLRAQSLWAERITLTAAQGPTAAKSPPDAVPPSVSPEPRNPEPKNTIGLIPEQTTWRAPSNRPSYLRSKMSRSSRSRTVFESPDERPSEPYAESSWVGDETLSESSRGPGIAFASDLPQDWSVAAPSSLMPHSAALGSPQAYAEPAGFAVVGDLAPVQPTAWADDQPTSGDYNIAGGVLGDSSEFPLLWGGGERLYARAEYLRWKIQGNYVPALVTSSPAGTTQSEAGVLGFGTTTILFGDSNFHAENRPGGRLTVGYWLSSDDVYGIEATFYQLESSTARFSAASTGDPILARPFFNVDPMVGPGQDSSILAMTGWVGTLPQFGAASVDLQGDVSVFARNELRSGAISLRGVSVLGGQNADWRTDWLAGYRYFDFNELLAIEDTIFPSSAPFIMGTRLDGVDRFGAKNRFHGGELAASTRFRRGRFSGEFIGRVAVGNMHEEMSIQGTTTVFVPAAGMSPAQTVVIPGALLTQASNSGIFRRDRLTVIPEVSVNLNFQVNKNLSLTGGYTLIYVNQIVRAADQIDTSLNSSMFGGAAGAGSANPSFTFAETEMLIHGLSGGVEFRY